MTAAEEGAARRAGRAPGPRALRSVSGGGGLSGYFSHELSKAYGHHGLSVSDWRILAFVAANPRCTSAELTSRSHLDEVAVHRAVTSLLARGLVRCG